MASLEEKLERVTRTELMERSFGLRVEDIVMFSKILLEQLGKEKAIELIKKARWGLRYDQGKEAAAKLGNPKDLDTFIEEYFIKKMDGLPFVPPIELRERTKNRVIAGAPVCFLSEAILKRNLDKDLLDVVKAYCIHDEAWAAGWNPDMKVEKVKFLMDGDDSCDFLCEVEE